jgi:hypothetical protein
MFIFQLMGGIGNQMFQYAAARALYIKTGIPFKVHFDDPYKDVTRVYNLDVFNLEVQHPSNKELQQLAPLTGIKKRISDLLPIFGKRHYFQEKKYFVFDDQFFACANDTYFYGFWQTEKYFKQIENQIRKDFDFKIPPSIANKKLIEQITNTEAVSIHIRRGDYVTVEKTNTVHGVCSLDYYQKAIDLIVDKIPHAVFYFFSDDMDWVKANMHIEQPSVYVDINDDAHNYEDLRLMSNCKHNIIANSSFSWWGAWLNNNPTKIVVAPQKWANVEGLNTSDLIPATWIRL